MVPIFATHLRSAQMSKPGLSSPFYSGKEATNQGSRLGEHTQDGDKKKPRNIAGAERKTELISHTDHGEVLSCRRSWNSFISEHLWLTLRAWNMFWICCFSSKQISNLTLGQNGARVAEAWECGVWRQPSSSPQAICREGIAVHREWKWLLLWRAF